ncbi:MAG: hypothetical protein LBT75_05665 [Bacilli bacterium]|nr:hypothetical protein [Bacilli bacterium]
MLKNKKTRVLFIILTIMVCFLAIIEVKNMIDLKNKKTSVVLVNKKIGIYDVSPNQSNYEKELEPLLLKALSNKDDTTITNEVSKYFISEYFSLKDKNNYNQVGGLGFILEANRNNFKTNAVDSYYRDYAQFKKVYEQAQLPLITNVEIIKRTDKKRSVISNNTNLNKVVDIDVKWSYEDNNINNIVSSIIVRLVKDKDNNWYIYELISNN